MAVNFKYWDDCIDPIEMEEMWGIPEVRTEWLDAGESRGRRVHLSRAPDGQPYLTQTEMQLNPMYPLMEEITINKHRKLTWVECHYSKHVNNLLGLNTLGISLTCIDFAPYGLNPPHTHLRATEILIVVEGTLYVGFATSNTNNRLFTKVLNRGDVFVFTVGLIHFQLNVRKTNAIDLVGLTSQNPRVITIAKTVFGSNPLINPDVLTKTFQRDENVVNYLQKQF
ncbi:Germin-like protein subfamily 1 member 17 [Morella rubra]|uniref:Germin-like protein n=1 Tax=Morella rubra TaxID=262757 RepID=A0A6A1V3G5_9ROSI|nr:Germin-like protein subfamily 1 member 17 [Morella rubra]